MKRKLVIVFAFVVTCAIMLIYRERLAALLAPVDSEAARFAEVNLNDPTVEAATSTFFSQHQSLPFANSFGSKASTELLLRSSRKLAKMPPVESSVRHATNLFGQQLSGTGTYAQAGLGSGKARLELTFGSGDLKYHVTQINDGRFLYVSNNSITDPAIQRIDLKTLEPGSIADRPNATSHQNGSSSWMQMGGLSFLMHQLAMDFDFTAPNRGTFDGEELTLLQGRWKPQRLRDICGKVKVLNENREVDLDRVPPQLPTHVEILLSSAESVDLFPRRITRLRETDSADNASEQAAPTVLASYEFPDAKLATRLSAASFQVEKSSAHLADITDAFLRNADNSLRIR